MKWVQQIKNHMTVEWILPGVVVLFTVGYYIRVDGNWDWGQYVDFIAVITVAIVTGVSFLTAGMTEKDRRHFEKDLIEKVTSDQKDFEVALKERITRDNQDFANKLIQTTADRREDFEERLAEKMMKNREHFTKKMENVRRTERREERALDASRHEMGSIKGGLQRIAERADELPAHANFTIRIPSKLRHILTIEDETDERGSDG